MNIDFIEFTNIICNKIERDGGESHLIMINGGVMKLWLSENGDGVMNSRYTALNCKFKILFAILNKAIALGGQMDLGANAAQNGLRIGSNGLSVDTIDGYISTEFYGKDIGEKTLRRSTYYAAILDWAGFVTNHRGGYITVNKIFMQ